MANNVPPELLEKAKKVKAVVLDSLGVLFPAEVIFSKEGGETYRIRSHSDGQGLSLLRAAGIWVAFITSEKEGYVEKLGEKLNNLPSVKSGVWSEIGLFTADAGKDKVAIIQTWLSEKGIGWDECAYMGDDVGDVTIMQKVGFSACPFQAEPVAKKYAAFITERSGGYGAIRDLVNFILDAKEIKQEELSGK